MADRIRERDLDSLIALELSRLGAVSFRNNTGLGWTGDVRRLTDGSIIIRKPRPLHAGLCKGSSDRVGWVSIEIRPEHLGRCIAVFLGVELKHPNGGRVTVEQENFIRTLNEAGGIGIIARSAAEVRGGIDEWIMRTP